MGKVIATFRDVDRAERAVHALKEAGVEDHDISLVSKDTRKNGAHSENGHHDLTSGATWGAGIGAGTALLATAGLIAIPGIGPILALGPLAAGLTGAAAGGMVGAFVDWGMPKQEGEHLQKEVQEGRAVILVKTSDTHKIQGILEQHAHEVQVLEHDQSPHQNHEGQRPQHATVRQ